MSIRQNGKTIAGATQYHPDLFDWKWADHQLDDVQWLRADTFSWQSGLVYIAAYQHLVDDYNNTGEHLYGWSTDTFSKTPYPSVGDVLYRSDGTEWSTVAYVAADYSYIIRSDGVAQLNRNTSIDTVLYETHTETIAGVTITYYQAPDGHKLVLPDQESNVTAIYNATGVAWYYIIDTTNQRFKLPRTKFGVTGIRSGVGNYVEAGLPNITGNTHWIGAVFNNNNTSYANGVFSAFDSNNGAYAGGGGYGNAAGRLNFNASRSSSIYGNSDTVQPKATEMYLYFYVGNFTQTALENTAGLNAELFNGKVDTGHQVIAFQAPTAANGYTWYRKYADGWVEQGGIKNQASNSAQALVLPVEMSGSTYSVLTSVMDDSLSNYVFCVKVTSKTTTGFNTTVWGSYNQGIATSGYNFVWQVSGMAA